MKPDRNIVQVQLYFDQQQTIRIMDPPLEDIDFLARSQHRVGVLAVLTEGSYDRRDLQNITGASASTISHVLGDLVRIHWSRFVTASFEEIDCPLVDGLVFSYQPPFDNSLLVSEIDSHRAVVNAH